MSELRRGRPREIVTRDKAEESVDVSGRRSRSADVSGSRSRREESTVGRSPAGVTSRRGLEGGAIVGVVLVCWGGGDGDEGGEGVPSVWRFRTSVEVDGEVGESSGGKMKSVGELVVRECEKRQSGDQCDGFKYRLEALRRTPVSVSVGVGESVMETGVVGKRTIRG